MQSNKNIDSGEKRQRRSELSLENNKNNYYLKLYSTNLKKFRKQKNWSIRKLGFESGISFSTISEIESFISKPNFDTITYLAKALEVEIFMFFIDDKVK